MTGDVSPGTSAGPASRVRTSLPELVAHVATEYRLGGVVDWSVLATGYEDCNIDLRSIPRRSIGGQTFCVINCAQPCRSNPERN